MTISSGTAQARDLSELRNHLKWLDEERRKAAKKMTELEQRLAQQGRELAEREQRIQELEWQLGQVNERFDRMPDVNTNESGHEQRLQDLEWHLSNINAQLVRLPKLDEELIRYRDELNRSATEIETRLWSTQNAAIEQLNTQATGNAESLRVVEGDLADLAARMSLLPKVDDELLALRNRLDATPSIDPLMVVALEQRMEELERALSVQEAAYDQLARSNMVVVEDHLSRLDQQIQSTSAAMDVRSATLVQETQALVLTDIEDLRARLDAIPNLDIRLAAFQEDVTKATAEYDARLASAQVEIDQQVQEAIRQAEATLSADIEGLRARLDAIPDIDVKLAAFREDIMAATAEFETRTSAAQAEYEARTSTAQADIDDLRLRLDAIPNFDAKLAAFREDITMVTAEYEARTSAAQLEAREQLQAFMDSAQFPMAYERIERLEESLSSLPAIREAVTALARLEQDMEFRQAEETRLGNLIGVQEAKVAPLGMAVDELNQALADLQKRLTNADASVQELRAGLTDLNDNWKPSLLETRNRLMPLSERVTIINSSLPRLEATLETVANDQVNLREALSSLGDHVSANQQDVTRQIEAWQVVQDEQKDTVERFTQQWLTLSNQYKEARMAVQNFAHWQKQLEQQKREASELVRIESNRLQSRWEGFLLEIQEKLKNSELDLVQKWQSFEMDNEQRWAAVRRTEQQWRDELGAIDELILKLQQDNRNLIWRVQAAQADAIKKWPRLLLEEVEKAVELNPQRRLQPAVGPVSRADLSVADAIEQGLIKVDYEDEQDGA